VGAARRGVSGLEISARGPDMTPLWDPVEPMWECVVRRSGLPVLFHNESAAGCGRTTYKASPAEGALSHAPRPPASPRFQMYMFGVCLSVIIFPGACSRITRMQIVNRRSRLPLGPLSAAVVTTKTR